MTSRNDRLLCADIRNNDSTNVSSFDIRVRRANAAAFQLEGFAGTGTNSASVESFIATQNPLSTAGVQTGGTGTIVNYANGTCNTPSP